MKRYKQYHRVPKWLKMDLIYMQTKQKKKERKILVTVTNMIEAKYRRTSTNRTL